MSGDENHKPAREEVLWMEEYRCKIAAARIEDLRCQILFDGAVVDIEDQRCRNLNLGAMIEIEDSRCHIPTLQLEDPRCNNLRASW